LQVPWLGPNKQMFLWKTMHKVAYVTVQEQVVFPLENEDYTEENQERRQKREARKLKSFEMSRKMHSKQVFEKVMKERFAGEFEVLKLEPAPLTKNMVEAEIRRSLTQLNSSQQQQFQKEASARPSVSNLRNEISIADGDALEKLKLELMDGFRYELNRAKVEIVDAMRVELLKMAKALAED
jgi:hypothetical protein